MTRGDGCPHCGAAGTGISRAVVILGLVLAGCPGEGGDSDSSTVVALYGVTAVDADGDGFTGDDCDDGDEEIHPGAAETPGDEVDSNCDGEDDT